MTTKCFASRRIQLMSGLPEGYSGPKTVCEDLVLNVLFQVTND